MAVVVTGKVVGPAGRSAVAPGQGDDYNQNEPHYYQPDATGSGDGGGGYDVRRDPPNRRSSGGSFDGRHRSDDRDEEDNGEEDEEEDACMHPMHMAVFFFSLLSMIFCIVALSTPSIYVIASTSNEYFGIFTYKYNSESVQSMQYVDKSYTNCEVRTADQWKTRQLMSQVAIILGAVFSLATLILTFAGTKRGPANYALVVVTFLAFLFTLLGVVRLVYTYQVWLFCDTSYCDMAREDPAIKDTITGCTSGYGYSFALVVISVGATFFSVIFSVMRVCFADWYLRRGSSESGESRRRQVARRYDADEPLYQQRRREEVNDDRHPQQQREEDVQSQNAWTEEPTEQQTAAVVSQSPTAAAAATPRTRSPSRGGQDANRTSPGRRPPGVSPASSPAGGVSPGDRGHAVGGPAKDDLPPGNWVWDEECGLYWSEDEYLYLDPETKHYYDPKSDQWYNPENDEWYEGANEEEEEEQK